MFGPDEKIDQAERNKLTKLGDAIASHLQL